MPLDPAFRIRFPALRDDDFVEMSPDAAEYNCIAHAADNSERWWWPSGVNYWPDGAPLEVTLAAFQSAYATLGYEPCEDHTFEEDYEKVAIYADSGGRPLHAAKQLGNGRWTSKLGSLIDIDHATLDCLAGGDYGAVAMILRRPSGQ
jgi:hypothetical protein